MSVCKGVEYTKPSRKVVVAVPVNILVCVCWFPVDL